MYQEDHGIIHNRFYDRKLQANITFGTQLDGLWADPKVEPIWITAAKQVLITKQFSLELKNVSII